MSSLKKEGHEVITIIESYNTCNMNFPKNLIFHIPFLNDNIDYLKSFPGFSSIRSGGTNADIIFQGMFGFRLRILDGSSEIFGACASRMDSSSAYIFSRKF